MTVTSWERTGFSPQGADCSTAGAAGTCHKSASKNHNTLPSLLVLSRAVVLSGVLLSILLVVIS